MKNITYMYNEYILNHQFKTNLKLQDKGNSIQTSKFIHETKFVLRKGMRNSHKGY